MKRRAGKEGKETKLVIAEVGKKNELTRRKRKRKSKKRTQQRNKRKRVKLRKKR